MLKLVPKFFIKTAEFTNYYNILLNNMKVKVYNNCVTH